MMGDELNVFEETGPYRLLTEEDPPGIYIFSEDKLYAWVKCTSNAICTSIPITLAHKTLQLMRDCQQIQHRLQKLEEQQEERVNRLQDMRIPIEITEDEPNKGIPLLGKPMSGSAGISALVALKESGFATHEIIELAHAGLLNK